MKLGLRAQNQCRMTLETLAAIKNPPVVYAKLANINQGSGNQQVNNDTPAPDNPNASHAHATMHTHAGKTLNQPNELLTKGTSNEAMDTRGTGETIGKNTAMATLD